MNIRVQDNPEDMLFFSITADYSIVPLDLLQLLTNNNKGLKSLNGIRCWFILRHTHAIAPKAVLNLTPLIARACV